MKGQKKTNMAEKGITLVTLVITVILLIILAAIAIRSLVGNDGMVETTLTAKEEHTIAEYKSSLEQVSQSVIMSNNIKGKETTLTEIADKVKELEWVKKADPYEEGKYVYVVSKEGYMFEIYYDSMYGTLEVEYIGKEPKPGEDIAYPTVKARYEQSVESILAEASVSKGSIVKIELIYKGDVIGTLDNPIRRSKV